MRKTRRITALVTALITTVGVGDALAERADYGQIELTGLARDVSWPLNAPGVSNAMVCNVNGPDGFLSIRSGPATSYRAVRKLKRLATVEVDTSQRQGRWVRVRTAYRTFTPDGRAQGYKDLSVSGWAHDRYLCSYIDYPAQTAVAPPPPPPPPPAPGHGSVVAAPQGKPARCEWDAGYGSPEIYSCQFFDLDGRGSFSVVRADGYELVLDITRPGVGVLTEFLDGRRGIEYGQFNRSNVDRACWNSATGSEAICAR